MTGEIDGEESEFKLIGKKLQDANFPQTLV